MKGAFDAAPDQAERGLVPHSVQRFTKFIDEKGCRRLSLAEICAAVKVSKRSLQIDCARHLGMSPIRYLKSNRMRLARDELLRGNQQTLTVTEVALRYGFSEFGRFSATYRRMFGELPSQSLRRYGAVRKHSGLNHQ